MEWLTRPSSRTAPTASKSRLLMLPAELRALILEYALTSAVPVVAFRLDAFQAESYVQATPPAITQVNRQLRGEGLPIWYDCNTIVLHTEGGSKGDHTRWWLARLESHLPLLRRVEIWLRYVTRLPYRQPSQGVLCLPMTRQPNVMQGKWKVAGDGWRWVTVVRKPDNVDEDAEFLVTTLKQLLDNENTTYSGPQGIWELLVDLRMWYIKHKMGP